MSLLRQIVVAVGLIGGLALPNAADAGLIVTASGVTEPAGGVLSVPSGGFTLSNPVSWAGFVDITLEAGSPGPVTFIFDLALVDVKAPGVWDTIIATDSVGGVGIPLNPGETFHSILGSGINPDRLNAVLAPGQTTMNLDLVVTNLRETPPIATPEPSAVALACTAAPVGLAFAWKRRRKAA